MKNKISKIIGLLVIFLLALTIKSFASYSSNDPSVKSGATFSITVKSSSKLESYDMELVSYSGLTYKGCSASGAAVNSSTGKVSYASLDGTSTLGTYTFKAPEVTEKKKYTVKFSINGTTNTSTVTVSPKTTSSSSSSSSSSNSSSSSSEQKPSFTSTNQKVYAKDNINLRSSWSTSSSAVSVKKGTEMTLTGTSSKAVNEYVWYRVSYNGSTKYVSSSLVTTTKPTDSTTDTKTDDTADKKDSSKATSTNLKSLTVTPTGLSPAFSTGTTEYTMTVGSNIDKIEVNAVAEDNNASVIVEGNKNITIGNNKITITVTAGENTKIYHINVTKENKKQLQLSELLVDGQPLNPEFDSNIYEYTIEKTNTAELNITATPSSSSAEVEILGNTDFKVGENIVTILVKSSNGEDVTTYQITVNVAQSDAIAVDKNNGSDNKKMYLYIGLGVVGTIILIIIIISIAKHKKEDDVVEKVNLYDGMYNPRGNDEEDDTPSVDTNNLPKLDNEDLPKSLRKNDFEKKLEEKQNKMSERSKKIDEFYNTQDDNTREKRKGKHSK